MSDFKVTKQQKLFFDTFGFLVFRGLMKDRMEEITVEFDKVFKNGGIQHDYKKSVYLLGFIDASEGLSSLLDDPRIHEITSSILGEDCNYLASSGNYYVGDTGWHADVPLDPPWEGSLRSINVSFYLDPVTHDTGALRVVPGSHFLGDQFTDTLTEGIKEGKIMDQWGIDRSEIPAVPLAVRPGDVVVFNNYLKHASFGGGNNRRVLLMNFSKRYIKERRHDLEQFVYGEPMLRTAGSERMGFLQQVLEALEGIGKLPELNEKAKAAYDGRARRL